jgi:hypothetical protein
LQHIDTVVLAGRHRPADERSSGVEAAGPLVQRVGDAIAGRAVNEGQRAARRV